MLTKARQFLSNHLTTVRSRAWRRMRGACRGTRRRGAHNPRLIRARKTAATRAGRKWRAGR